ncbi:MAG: (Fe-S)-binding protein [Candidatus Helarchaeales archaeon]
MKGRKNCPTSEINPDEFVNPLKVKIQAKFFPLISKIKKMPPPMRKWDYSTGTWKFLGSKPMGTKPAGVKPAGMKPSGMKPMGAKPNGSKPVGMKPNGMKAPSSKPLAAKPIGMKKGEKLKKLYNCIHCNRCKSSESRIKLKQKMFERGQVPDDFVDLFKSYSKFKTPLNRNSMRIKRPEFLDENSSTLLFLGCFTSMKVPRMAEHAMDYLHSQGIKFTLLQNEICCGLSLKVSGEKILFNQLKNENLKIFKEKGIKEIICICPACYNTFRRNYKKSGIKFSYILEYLKPNDSLDAGKSINIQHSCHLLYEGKKKLAKRVEKVLKDSGFSVKEVPHWCCGGGMGQIYIPETIEKIGRTRVRDFTENIVTAYCPSCYWMLKINGKKEKTEYELIDLYQLLS